ncbi:MAG: CoA-binding protein [Candidatus Binatia bacterium]
MSRFHAQLDRAFNARVVAVVGDKRHNAFIWLRGLRNFSRQLYSVQIEPKEVAAIEAMGVRNVRSLSEIPEPIDYAVLVVPRAAVPSALRDCARQQVGAVTVFTAGFSETGEVEGIRLEQEILAIARQANLLVIGPNCMGVANPRLGLCNFPGEASGPEAAGPVAFMGQSGTHTITFCMRAPAEGVGISKAVSFGNALTADAADYLDYLRTDDETSVICAYIEGVRDGRRFYDVLRQTTPTKPVILWKGGVSAAGQRAIFSHTAALATPQAVWQGMVRQAGAISVESQDELLDVARTLLAGKSAHGWRAGLVAMTGGPSVVMTDVFTETGLEVPLLADASYAKLAQFFRVVGGGLGNPLDAGSTIAMGFDADNLKRLLEVLHDDPGIDLIALDLGGSMSLDRWNDYPTKVQPVFDLLAAFATRSHKPFAVVLEAPHRPVEVAQRCDELRRDGVLTFASPQRAARALRRAVEYWRFRAGVE